MYLCGVGLGRVWKSVCARNTDVCVIRVERAAFRAMQVVWCLLFGHGHMWSV